MRTWIAGLVLIGTLITIPCNGADIETSAPVENLSRKAPPAGKPSPERKKQLGKRRKLLEAQKQEVRDRERMDIALGLQISPDDDKYANQPSNARTADGTVWVAWVQNTGNETDEIVVSGFKAGSRTSIISGPVKISGAGTQFVRPVLVASGNALWCFWTESSEQEHARIWYAYSEKGVWQEARRFLPEETRAHQNPEAAAMANGSLAIVYQVHDWNSYEVHLATRTAGAPAGEPFDREHGSISGVESSDWDPTAAWDSEGRLHLAWSGYHEGDYDIYHARLDDGNIASAPRRISARGEYDMHPWLAAGANGEVWLSWDVVKIPAHGSSGATTITGANLEGRVKPKPEDSTGNFGLWSGIEVRVFDGDDVRIPGDPRGEITAPAGYKLAHRALAKVAVSGDGQPWIIYRALLQPIAQWSTSNRDGYLWEVIARPFRDGQWTDPVLLHQSDGYLEEPAVVPSPEGLRIAYTSEHRHATARKVAFHVKREGDADGATTVPLGEDDHSSTDPLSPFYNHHHDFQGMMGWHGDVYLATIEDRPGASEIEVGLLAEERAPADEPVVQRLSRSMGRHQVEMKGTTYSLLWGDTHRHSNVSRCSLGTEPSPEDLYRYGLDINLYDFLAISDHSEYTTDYYWFRQQKIGDLYHIPGSLSVLYNSEWSMRFPYGHTNTLFPDRRKVKMHGWMGDATTWEKGWDLLSKGGYRAITIPHTSADPGMGTTWPAHDPRYQRLVEIFQSGRGSYEFDGCLRQHEQATNKAGFYWKALEKGYRIGVICSSDHSYNCAYACVYAPENTRESVWQAMWDRRTYGSTSYGIVVDFRSGDRWMGEEWSSSEAPKLDVYVRGAVSLRSVEIVGRSGTLYAAGSLESPLNQLEHRMSWTDPDWDQQTAEQWYYVRVVQSDDEMAWSSPVWVKPER